MTGLHWVVKSSWSASDSKAVAILNTSDACNGREVRIPNIYNQGHPTKPIFGGEKIPPVVITEIG